MPQQDEDLDRYLHTVFQLIEGGADVEEAFSTLQEYLAWHRQNKLPSDLERLLIHLFFFKCRKEFSQMD